MTEKDRAENRRENVRRSLTICAVLVAAFGLRVFANNACLPGTRLLGWEEDLVVERGMGILLGYVPALQWPGSTHFILFAMVGGLMFLITHLHEIIVSLGSGLFGAINVVDRFFIQFFRDPSPYYLMGRYLEAVIGITCVYAVYRIGRELEYEKGGLLAAALWALSPGSVYRGHVVNVDDLMLLLFLWAIYYSIRYRRGGRLKDVCLAAALGGLSVGAKLNGVFALIPVLGAVIGRSFVEDRSSLISLLLRRFSLVIVFFMLGLNVGCPYLITNPPVMAKFLVFKAGVFVLFGESHNGWWLILSQYMPAEIGLVPTLLGITGLMASGFGKKEGVSLLWSLALIYFIMLGRSATQYSNYAMPLGPLLCLGAGVTISIAAARMYKTAAWWAKPAAVLLVAGAMAEPAYGAVRVERNLLLDDTRIIASRWIEKNIKSGSRILLTGFGDPPLHQSRQGLERELKSLEGPGLFQNQYSAFRDYIRLKVGEKWGRTLLEGEKFPFLSMLEGIVAEEEFDRAKIYFLLADPVPLEPAYDITWAQPVNVEPGRFVERVLTGEFRAVLIHPGETVLAPYARLRAAAMKLVGEGNAHLVTFAGQPGKNVGTGLELFIITLPEPNLDLSLPPGTFEGPLR